MKVGCVDKGEQAVLRKASFAPCTLRRSRVDSSHSIPAKKLDLYAVKNQGCCGRTELRLVRADESDFVLVTGRSWVDSAPEGYRRRGESNWGAVWAAVQTTCRFKEEFSLNESTHQYERRRSERTA